MHLEELEKLENEYNISLLEQDKLYMIVNEHTLVIHKDGTYTLIKGDKINESCSGFKYVGVHSIEGKKKVDLNGHSLKGDNLLGNVYSVDDCNTTIEREGQEYIINAKKNTTDNAFLLYLNENTTIGNITAILEEESIKKLLNIDNKWHSIGGVWPGVQHQSSPKGSMPPTVIQPVLWKGSNISNYIAPPRYPNYVWIYDKYTNTYIKSDAWQDQDVDKYDKYYNNISGGMNLYLVVNGEWKKYNSYTSPDDYEKEIHNSDSWYVNSQYVVNYADYYKPGGQSAMFNIFSRDIIKIPKTCNKIIFNINRDNSGIEVLATVVDNNAPGPHPITKLAVYEYYSPLASGGGQYNIFRTSTFENKSAFDIFNSVIPFAVESQYSTLYDTLKVTLSVSAEAIMFSNNSTYNTICTITPPPTPLSYTGLCGDSSDNAYKLNKRPCIVDNDCLGIDKCFSMQGLSPQPPPPIATTHCGNKQMQTQNCSSMQLNDCSNYWYYNKPSNSSLDQDYWAFSCSIESGYHGDSCTHDNELEDQNCIPPTPPPTPKTPRRNIIEK